MSTISYLNAVPDSRRQAAARPYATARAAVLHTISQPPLSTFQPNQMIFCEGDPATHIFEIAEGIVRLCRLLPDGRRAITGFLYPGDLTGISATLRHAFTAEAVTPVKLRRHARSHFEAAASRSPELSQRLFGIMRDEMSAALDQLLLLGRKTAHERVASFLLVVARRASGIRTRSQVDLPMTRLDIADHLGLTLETVSRAFAKFKNDGLIALPTPHTVILLRPDLLCQLAGEDEGDEEADRQPQRVAAWAH